MVGLPQAPRSAAWALAAGLLVCTGWASSPTPSPTTADDFLLRKSAAWAGAGREGLFNAINSQLIYPGGAEVNVTFTIEGAPVRDGDVFLYGAEDLATLNVTVQGRGDRFYLVMLLDLDGGLGPSNPALRESPCATCPGVGAFVHAAWANVRAGQLVAPENANVLSWVAPAPSHGSHRLALLAYEQPSNVGTAFLREVGMGYASSATRDVANRWALAAAQAAPPYPRWGSAVAAAAATAPHPSPTPVVRHSYLESPLYLSII